MCYKINFFFLFKLQIVRDEITELVETQRDLEEKFENVLAEKEAIQKTTQKKNHLAEVEKTVGSFGGNLRNSTHVFARSLRQNPLTVDNITKIQTDRWVGGWLSIMTMSPPGADWEEITAAISCNSYKGDKQ